MQHRETECNSLIVSRNTKCNVNNSVALCNVKGTIL